MASSSSYLQLSSSLFFLVAIIIIPAAYSQNCASQTFTQRNTTFASCTNLPTLNASIHWTYNSSARPNPTLNIAFIAPPATPQGWVAWGLNPTGTGMVGAQSLVAFRDTNGSVVVRTYNITSYSSIAESRISYAVSNLRGEYSDGVFRLFATLALPSTTANGGEINQVWQVGASVRNGLPERHAFQPGNLNARNTLQLVGATAIAPSPSTRGGGGGGGVASPPRTQSGNDSGAGSLKAHAVGVYGILVLLGLLIFKF